MMKNPTPWRKKYSQPYTVQWAMAALCVKYLLQAIPGCFGDDEIYWVDL